MKISKILIDHKLNRGTKIAAKPPYTNNSVIFCIQKFGFHIFQMPNTKARPKAICHGTKTPNTIVNEIVNAMRNHNFQIQSKLYFINSNNTPVPIKIEIITGTKEVFSSICGRSPTGSSLNEVFPNSSLFTGSI